MIGSDELIFSFARNVCAVYTVKKQKFDVLFQRTRSDYLPEPRKRENREQEPVKS